MMNADTRTQPFATTAPPHKVSRITRFIWLIALGSIVGFVVETIFALLVSGQLERRSALVYGPFNLVYGFGAVALYFCFYRTPHSFRQRKLAVFLVGAAACTVVEYLCSWLQEELFGSVSWDYRALPFDINGRVCLPYASAWGVLALVWVAYIMPLFDRMMARIPPHTLYLATMAVMLYLLADAAISAMAIWRWAVRSDGVAAVSAMGHWLDSQFPDEKMRYLYTNLQFLGR